jgi:iron complex transport system permease protein
MKRIVLTIGWVAGFILAIFSGAYPLSELFHGPGFEVLWKLRLPLAVGLTLSGFSLGSSGVLLQGLFRNPLADPALFGFSAGASFFALLYVAFLGALGSSFLFLMSSLPLVAFLGAIFSMIVLFVLDRWSPLKSPGTLLLFGVGWSVFLAALSGLIFLRLSDPSLHFILWWGFGGSFFSGVGLLIMAGGLLIVGVCRVQSDLKSLDVMVLGEAEASHLGVNLQKLRTQILFSVALLIGISVALTGPISFVGLMMPHLGRILFGFKHSSLFWVSGVLGSQFLLFSHAISSQFFYPMEPPLGIVASLVGVPCFFYWLRKARC